MATPEQRSAAISQLDLPRKVLFYTIALIAVPPVAFYKYNWPDRATDEYPGGRVADGILKLIGAKIPTVPENPDQGAQF